jgi:hypothetical protein
MKRVRLHEMAKTIRSKNAGVDKITFDVICRNYREFDLIRKSDVITRRSMCELLGVNEDRMTDFVEFEPANAIKFTLYRRCPSGSPGDMDIFGSQQYGPLFDVEIPVPDDWEPSR